MKDSTARNPKDRRRLEQELLLESAAELIARLMDEKRMSRAELARHIGKSKAFVTQILRGRHNMTLRTLADLAWALKARVQMKPSPRKTPRRRSILELQGLGKEIWQGVEVQAYVDAERVSWNG